MAISPSLLYDCDVLFFFSLFLQYVSKLADNLNAEIVQGTVQSVAEAAQWLGYTYLYVRMLKNPEVYGVPPDLPDDDPTLLQFRVDLVRHEVVSSPIPGLDFFWNSCFFFLLDTK